MTLYSSTDPFPFILNAVSSQTGGARSFPTLIASGIAADVACPIGTTQIVAQNISVNGLNMFQRMPQIANVSAYTIGIVSVENTGGVAGTARLNVGTNNSATLDIAFAIGEKKTLVGVVADGFTLATIGAAQRNLQLVVAGSAMTVRATAGQGGVYTLLIPVLIP